MWHEASSSSTVAAATSLSRSDRTAPPSGRVPSDPNVPGGVPSDLQMIVIHVKPSLNEIVEDRSQRGGCL